MHSYFIKASRQHICVGVCMCGCFGNMCTCIYCVLCCM